MPYQTFIVNATATFLATSLYAGHIESDYSKKYSSLDKGYSTMAIEKTYSDFEHQNSYRNSAINDEISILLDFATKLLNNSTPLDGDIVKLVNDNIMDLLA